ncbi:MAG: DUF4153 domain-containing protein [Bacilli bacterium]|nr:DUF4153 domain-containing protein [Bacilli bacterium]
MSEIKKNLVNILNKYYVSILLFILATIQLMVVIKYDYDGLVVDERIIKLIMTFIYGAITSMVIRNMIDKKLSYIWYLVTLFLMLVVYVEFDFNDSFQGLSYLITCFLTALLFLVVPFRKRDEDSEYYSYRVIMSLVITGICYSLLILGIFLIMGSISILFEIKIQEYIYIQIALFILGCLMPTLFLSIIPSSDERKEYPSLIKIIVMYLILPMLSIYTVVLYAYFIKILVEFQIPSNMLGNLVIYYSLISIFVLYFIHKMKDNKWVTNFINIYPFVLIIPMLMMLISFVIRIGEYGFTVARYYALICFVFVSISILIIKLKKKVKYIPVTLSILLLISIFGPLSATNISKISQEHRLKKVLEANHMLVDDSIVKSDHLSDEDKRKIYDILIYFDNYYDLDDISILPDDFELEDVEEVFGFNN